MLDFGSFKLRETEDYETYYVGASDTHIILTKELSDLSMYDRVGKIEVYHDGMYFGTPEEMDNWVREETIEYLIEKGYLLEDGETAFGEKCWKLKETL